MMDPAQTADGSDDDRQLDNPQRGCGYLETGKVYLRGVGSTGAGGDGIYPSFVVCDPPIPFREAGTDGEFTRGYESWDGTVGQAALESITSFHRLYPDDSGDDVSAVDNMIDLGIYDQHAEAPQTELDRHIDRVRFRTTNRTDPTTDHFASVDAVGSSDLIMRAGKTHYPDPQNYVEEARNHGVSKAIPASQNMEPPKVTPGVTRLWIVHPSTPVGWAVIGYSYLTEAVYTKPDDGRVPQYVQEWADAGKVNVAEVGPELDADGYADGDLHDFEDDDPGSSASDPQGSDGEDTVPATSDAEVTVPSARDGRSVAPAPDWVDPQADLRDQWTTAVDTDLFDYQSLRSLASDLPDVDGGRRPSQDDLIDRFVDAGHPPVDFILAAEDGYRLAKPGDRP